MASDASDYSRLPEEIICLLFRYLSHRDKEAASQVCRSWYEAASSDKKILSDIVVVISEEENEAFATFSRSLRQYRKIVLKELTIEFSGQRGEKRLNQWKNMVTKLEHLGIHSCSMNEKDFAELLSSCSSLRSLSISGCNDLFMSGRLFSEQIMDLKNLENVTRLSITSNRYFSDALLMRVISRLPNLKHLCLSDDQIAFHPGIKKKFYPEGKDRVYSESVLTFGIVLLALETRRCTLTSIDLSRTLIDNPGLITICKLDGMKITALGLAGCDQLSKDGFEAIATYQTNLEDLNVSSCSRFTDHVLIETCKKLRKLKVFNFSRCRAITDEGLKELTHLSEIESLNIGRSTSGYMISSGLSNALTNPLKANLTHLNISTLVISEYALEIMMSKLTSLEYLDLTACFLDDAVMKVIAKNLVRLKVLKLAYCDGVTDRGLTGIETGDENGETGHSVVTVPQDRYRISLGLPFEAVIREDASRKMAFKKQIENRSMEASGCSISNLKSLVELNLCGCKKITDISLTFSIKFVDLRALNLGYCNQITDEGLEILVSDTEPRNKSIEELILQECKNITDVGIAALLPKLKRLRILDLKGCSQLTDKSLETIKLSCHFLRYLDVSGCQKMSLEKSEELTNQLPRLDCRTQGLRSGALPGVKVIR